MSFWDQIKHFTPSEMACHHCGEVRMDEDFMRRLDKLRADCGFPFPVTSGYRCPEHNRDIGGGPAHPLGKAADIALRGYQVHTLIGLAGRHGFKGVGLQQKGSGRFVHLDTLQNGEGGAPRPWVWTY